MEGRPRGSLKWSQQFVPMWRLRNETPTPRVETARSDAAPPRCGALVLARRPRSALADPAPFLHQQFPVLAVGLQVDGGDDVARLPAPAARNSRTGASPSAHRPRSGGRSRRTASVRLRWMISGSNGDRICTGPSRSRPARSARLQHLRPGPVLRTSPAPSSATGTSSLRRTRASISAPHRRLARRVEMTDGIEADDALRTQARDRAGRR